VLARHGHELGVCVVSGVAALFVGVRFGSLSDKLTTSSVRSWCLRACVV
jgi:hypothetical protein